MQTTDTPTVFGAPYSVYVRAVRLSLEEKGVRYELVPVDIFALEGAPPEHKRDTRSAKSPRSSTPDSASMKRARLPAMSMRHFPVHRCNRKAPVAVPG